MDEAKLKARIERGRLLGLANGCLRVTHGMSRTPTYSSWTNARQRCSNPKNIRYDCYGERGIRMCERWATFENFLADMGEKPPGTSLDRINNNLGYEPGNCKWSTRAEQARNTTRNVVTEVTAAKVLEMRAGGMSIGKISAEIGLSRPNVQSIASGRTWAQVK